MKQVISCFLSKEFFISCLLTGENSKSNKNTYFEEYLRTAGCFWKIFFLIYNIIFKSIAFTLPVFINSNNELLRPSKYPWKILVK